MDTLVRADGLSFQYRQADTPALRDVSFTAEAGQMLLIAGRSGCGKSTLVRAVNGLIPHRYRGELSGSVTVAGRDVASTSLRDLAISVGTVLQNPARQIVASTVEAELAFGPENLGVPVADIRRRIAEVAQSCEITDLLGRETATLSGGQQQMLAIAGVFMLDPGIVVVDEPLANLDPAAAVRTLGMLRRLADRGAAVLIVEHRVEEVLDVAEPDAVLYLEDGRTAYFGDAAGFLAVADPSQVKLPFAAVLEHYRRLGHRPDVPPPRTVREISSDLPPRLDYRKVHAGYDGEEVLHGVSAAFPPGRTVAVIGANGSGKSTLLKTAMRLLPVTAGEVFVDGEPVASKSVAELARSVGYVFQNPSQMFFARTVTEELLFGAKNFGIARDEAVELAERSLARANLPELSELGQRPPLTLSFGQQKRLALAIALALRPRTLVLDEPTAGQDYGNTVHFLREVQGMADLDTLFFITHDVDLALTFADRIVIVSAGRLVEDCTPAELVDRWSDWESLGLRKTSLVGANASHQGKDILGAEELATRLLDAPSPT